MKLLLMELLIDFGFYLISLSLLEKLSLIGLLFLLKFFLEMVKQDIKEEKRLKAYKEARIKELDWIYRQEMKKPPRKRWWSAYLFVPAPEAPDEEIEIPIDF